MFGELLKARIFPLMHAIVLLLLQVLPYVTPGSTKFQNVSMAVDVVGILGYVAPPPSALKAGLIRIPLGWSGWGYWG